MTPIKCPHCKVPLDQHGEIDFETCLRAYAVKLNNERKTDQERTQGK